MRISFLHTADVHVATFDALLAGLDPSVERVHRVEPDLLARARDQGIDAVRDETCAILRQLADADAVVCTCSTLGPLVDDVSTSLAHVFRIDRPVMEEACADGENILVAICLENTREATLDLLNICAAEQSRTISPRVVLCASAWHHFEAGDMDAYARAISGTIRADLVAHARTDCVVLAQASMRVAEDRLGRIGVPVRSSPRLAAERSLEVARARLTTRR